MRILAVGNMYPPQHAGGYELAWQQAMHRANALGHRTRVLTSDYVEESARGEEDPDVHRTLRWYWDLERYEFPRLNVFQQLRLERHNAREFRHHLIKFKPDVVAWWSMGCMSLSLIEQARRAGMHARGPDGAPVGIPLGLPDDPEVLSAGGGLYGITVAILNGFKQQAAGFHRK